MVKGFFSSYDSDKINLGKKAKKIWREMAVFSRRSVTCINKRMNTSMKAKRTI